MWLFPGNFGRSKGLSRTFRKSTRLAFSRHVRGLVFLARVKTASIRGRSALRVPTQAFAARLAKWHLPAIRGRFRRYYANGETQLLGKEQALPLSPPHPAGFPHAGGGWLCWRRTLFFGPLHKVFDRQGINVSGSGRRPHLAVRRALSLSPWGPRMCSPKAANTSSPILGLVLAGTSWLLWIKVHTQKL